MQTRSVLKEFLFVLGGPRTPRSKHPRIISGEVPCGIFDDLSLVAKIKESVETIRKACLKFGELHESSGEGGPSVLDDLKQMNDCINSKEEHAKKIITIVAEDCLCQRVKMEVFENESDYVEAFHAHHEVMQCAMKCKESVDEETVDELEYAVKLLSKMYIRVEH